LDINEASSSVKFVFAHRDPASHTSVLSVARLGFTTAQVAATPTVIYERIYKMIKRTIGEQYLALPRSPDLGNVMYAPIMSLDDVDAMGRDYVRHPVPRGRFDLAPPPMGYTWQEVPAIAAAILVPEGWHFREERQGKTYALFVTEQEFGKDGFEVGVTVNAFLDNPAAPLRVTEMVRDVASKHAVDVHQGQKERMVILRCEFDSPRDRGREPVHVFYMALVNRETRTSYLGIVEAPVSQWAAASAKALPVLDRVRFASNL
jgi:hypothetical protein